MAKGRNTNTQTVPEQSLGLDPGTALSNAFDVGTEPSNFNPIGTQAASTSIDKTYSNVKLDKLNEEQKASTWFTQDDSQNEQVINERLGQDQSTADTWLKGVAKFVGKTGTAIVGGTLGVLYGVPASIGSGELNKLYDNDFNRALDKADEWMDDKMKVYQTKEQEEQAWYKQMVPFSGSSSKFWADDVLGGLSFTVGAILSETAWAAATAATFGGAEVGLAANTARLTSKAANLVKKIGQAENIASAGRFTRQLLTGAGYESGVEARHTKNEILTSMKKEYKDSFGTDVDEKSTQYAEMLDKANDAANSVFAANMALLSVGNAITLPKTFGQLNKGLGEVVESVENKLFNPIVKTERLSVSQLGRVAKATGKTVEELQQSQFINKWDTYNRLQKGISKTATVLKQPLSEGLFEEGGQGMISEAAKIYVAKKYDPSGIDQTVSLYDSMGEAFAKTYGSEKGWKEIGIGMIIGSMGLPHIGRKTNEDGTTSRDFSWQGGIRGEIAQSNAERAETADIVEMMNNNNALVSTKALWQAQIREAANEIDKQIVDGKFVEKNKDAESFFNYAHSRIKGGYYANIKDETAKQVKEMKLDEFADAFGYTNMTESELKQRQDEVVEKTVKRASQIKDAVELANKIDKFGIDDVKEGLAYSISMLNNIDERQDNMTKEMNKSLGFEFTKDDYKKLKSQKTLNYANRKGIEKLEKELNTLVSKNKDVTEIQKAINNLKKEYSEGIKTVQSFNEKSFLSKELERYSGDIEQVHNHLRNNDRVKQKMEELRQTNPDKVEEINQSFNDLESLDNRRKSFIESYNNLRTSEGQQAFTNDINNFKSYLFADIPQGLSKQSATLAYYKQVGEHLRGEIEKKSTPPTTQSISGTNVPPPARPASTVSNPVPVVPVQQNLIPEEEEEEVPTSGFFPSQTEPSYVEPVAPSALTPQQVAQAEFDKGNALIASMLIDPDSDSMEVSGAKAMTPAQRAAFMAKLQPIILSNYDNYKIIKPDATTKEVAKAIIDGVSKVQLTEPQFKTLMTMVNSVLGDDQSQWYFTTFDKQYNIPQQAVTIELAGLVPSPSANNLVLPAEYGHDKNNNSANSLAYLSHEYKDEQGKLETTKLAENENKQALLASNEVFNNSESIKAQAIVGTEPVNRLLLDNDVQIILEDGGQVVKTSIHDPRWVIEMNDVNGNSILDDKFIESMIGTALTNRPSLIVKAIEKKMLKRFKNTNVSNFRNSYGESIEEVVEQFVKLVKMKDAILSHPNKDQPFEVKITDISPGKISFLKGYENSTDALLQKDLKFGVVGMNGTIMATNTEPHSLNEKSLISADYWQDKQGTVVVFVPVKGKRFVPVALRNKKVEKFSKESNLMLGAVHEFLNPEPLKTSIAGQGLKLDTSKNVKKFLSIYSTFIHNLSKTDMTKQIGQILIDFSDANESKAKAVQIVIPQYVSDKQTGAASIFIRNIADINKTLGQIAKEQNLKIVEGTTNNGLKIDENTLMRDIILSHNIGKSVSTETSISEKSLVEGNAKVPTFVFNEDTNRIEQGEEIAYSDHIKSRTLSNVNGKIEDPTNKDKYMHIEQPVFTFEVDLSKKEVVQEVKQTKQESVKQEEPIVEERSSLFAPQTESFDVNAQAEIRQQSDNNSISYAVIDDFDDILVADTYSENKKNEVESQNTQCE